MQGQGRDGLGHSAEDTYPVFTGELSHAAVSPQRALLPPAAALGRHGVSRQQPPHAADDAALPVRGRNGLCHSEEHAQTISAPKTLAPAAGTCISRVGIILLFLLI